MHIVYKATSPSNKVYIGYTSMSLSERKKTHKCLAYSKNRKQYKFANAIKKYGWDNIKWEVIEKFDDRKKALSFEKYCITKLYNSIENGYNITTGGEFCEFSEESKRSLSKIQGGVWFRVFCKKSKKLLGTWLNQNKCEKDLGVSSKRIRDYLNYTRFHKDYYFIESKSFHSFDYIDYLERSRTKKGEWARKPIKVVCPNGKTKKFVKQEYAVNALGFTKKIVSKYLLEKREYKGYRFYYDC